MKKIITILLTIIITGCFAGKKLDGFNEKTYQNYKCDYIEEVGFGDYMDIIGPLILQGIMDYNDNVTIPKLQNFKNGLYCLRLQDNRSKVAFAYIPVKNGYINGTVVEIINEIKGVYTLDNGKITGIHASYIDNSTNYNQTLIRDYINNTEIIYNHTKGIRREASYSNNKLHGQVYVYNNNDILISTEEYSYGAITEKRTFDENGNVLGKIIYNNDVPFEIYIYEYDGYTLMEERLYTNKENIKKSTFYLKEYYNNGVLKVEKKVVNGKNHGEIILYNEDGKIFSKIQSNKGNLESAVIYHYYDNGEISEKITGTIDQKINILNGIKMTYYKSGLLKAEINLKNGKENGKVKSYYENGKIMADLFMKQGKIEGLAREYNKDGSLHNEVNYKNNKREGKQTVYNENGRVWAVITYKNDNPINGKCANGRKWTRAELLNWENGVTISCGY